MRTANRRRRQRTFRVDGKKITIISSLWTSAATQLGWNVTVNGTKYRLALLDREQAEDRAFMKWVEANT